MAGVFFKMTLTEGLNSIEDCIDAADDAEAMYTGVHKIVGSSRMIGFIRLG